MVQEVGILFWIKQLQQCRRRVTLVTSTHLVHLANNNSLRSYIFAPESKFPVSTCNSLPTSSRDPTALLFSANYLSHFFSQSTSVYSAYINLCFSYLHYRETLLMVLLSVTTCITTAVITTTALTTATNTKTAIILIIK